MFDIPVKVNSNVRIDGFLVRGTGFAPDYATAALKARSELIERIYTSDLVNEDTSGLFTYRQPPFWCSTGAAAHPNREVCLQNSLSEIIERDMLSCWMGISRIYQPITVVHDIELWKIPCIYKDWNVVVSVRRQENKTQIQAAASKVLEDAMLKAFYEAFLRPTLDETFLDSRLPKFEIGSFKEGSLPEPDLFLREWKVEDLFVTKYYGFHVGDFRRGISPIKADAYTKFMELTEWNQITLSKSLFR